MENNLKELPPRPIFIKPVTIYEGIGLLEIKEGFKPKGLIERFDYWCYCRSLLRNVKEAL